jgi:DtxR family Mn-dependent transcriptional regulator
MVDTVDLSASQEEYICSIWEIVRAKKAARAIDISRRMGVSGPSVTTALKSLSEKGLVNYAPYDLVTLTKQGERIAEDIERRQKILRTFLVKVLSIHPLLADENAKQMEHAMSPVVLGRLTKFIEYYESCPGEKVRWVDDQGYFCAKGLHQCATCVQTQR